MDPVTRVAINLTKILDLHGHLQAQAISQANARELPGGDAMIALAPVANIEAWENMQATSERTGLRLTAPELEDENDTPLQVITWWSERWRRVLEAEYDAQHHSITTEINFIRWNLQWAAVNEALWHNFADDIHKVLTRLESILKDGQRDIISEDVVCLLCGTQLRRRMTALDGYEDEWWCKECGLHLTPAQFNLAASEAARRKLGIG